MTKQTNDERLQKVCENLGINLDELQMDFARGIHAVHTDFGLHIESANAVGSLFAEAAGDDDKLDDLIIARIEEGISGNK